MNPETGEINIEQLEEEFKGVIEELKEDTGLTKFRKEYELLFTALKSSNERVHDYVGRFQQLKEGLLIDSYGVETALHQTENDEALKKKLLFNIDNIKKAIEDLKERDDKNQGRIEQHNNNIAQINQTIKNWQILNKGDQEIIERTNAIERLKNEIDFLKTRNANTKIQQKETKEKMVVIMVKKEQALALVTEKNAILVEGQRKMEEQDKQRTEEIKFIESLKRDREAYLSEKTQFIEMQKFLKESIESLKMEKLEISKKVKSHDKENSTLVKKELEFQKRFVDVSELNKIIKQDLSDRENDVKSLRIASEEKNKVLIKLEEHILVQEKRLAELTARGEVESKFEDEMREKILKVESECEELECHIQEKEKEYEELIRTTNLTRDLINKADISKQQHQENLLKVEKDNQLCYSRFNALKRQQSALNNELKSMKDENLKLMKDISHVASKFSALEEEIKHKTELIDKYTTSHTSHLIKLKQQQTLYENVKRDKLLCAKQLAEAQFEINELRRKYKSFVQNISTLKEEIDRKEELLTKEYFKTKELEKNCEAQRRTGDLLAVYLQKKNAFFTNLSEKINYLKESIETFKEQKEKIKEQLDVVISERDLLSSEVIKRHKELKVLYEKLKIIMYLFQSSAHSFNENAFSITIKKKNAKTFLIEIKKLNAEVRKIPELFLDYQLLEKDYLNEKLKCNFLVQELQSPMNIHQWRKLESTNNKSFEMLSKIYILTKTLISKNEDLKKKADDIKDQEENIKKIKEGLKRQPTFVEVELCDKLQITIKEKEDKLAEIETKISHAKNAFFESEFEVKHLEDELKQTKLKFSSSMKNRNRPLKLVVSTANLNSSGLPKIFGGGFVKKTMASHEHK
jgi:chromosome segregation ATPase